MVVMTSSFLGPGPMSEVGPLIALGALVLLAGLLRALQPGDLGDGHVPPVRRRRVGSVEVGLDNDRRGRVASGRRGVRVAELGDGAGLEHLHAVAADRKSTR